ncbi:MAG: histidine--tRNA ligase [Methermicoccaceae archaeon]
MREEVERWGYREVQTPVFEQLELFTLKSGDEIKEEIYTFQDRSGRSMALRPELTAPVIRMYVESMSRVPKPLRLYYFGNCFRYERPQRGRFREFWQFGVELVGGKEGYSEAELMALAHRLVMLVGVTTTVKVSHLGIMSSILSELDEGTRSMAMHCIDKRDIPALHELLPSDVLERVEQLLSLGGGDPFDILSEAVEIAGTSKAEQAGNTLTSVLKNLEMYETPFDIDFGIVRGLDYYRGVVFEMYAEGLGAQNQVCGGGSYSLTELFGGESTPTCGFGIGFDRLFEVTTVKPVKREKVVVVSAGAYEYAVEVACKLRQHLRWSVEMEVMDRHVREQLKHANAIGASYAVIVGPRERDMGLVTLRNLESGEQRELTLAELIPLLQDEHNEVYGV